MMLTIAMLSWGAENTLQNTLKSYYNWNLEAAQKIILLQEGTTEQENISRYFGFEPIVLPYNVGIANGYQRLLTEATGDTFLFLENDWELIHHPNIQLKFGQYLLDTGASDIVRYRSRENPGNPLWTRQFEGNEYSRSEHLLDSIHWTDPSKFLEITSRRFEYFDIASISLYDEAETYEAKTSVWYTTTAQYANWTNNPHMAKTSFLRNHVAPRMGIGDVEKDIQNWWQGTYYRVSQSDGLFTHNRLD